MAAGNKVGFQSLFEEVVKAKRLSSSKMQRLTELAMKNMENDTQMVSVMFRTHKTLSSTGKISSLYAFDALARAARDALDKKKVDADPNSTTGNCATFLLKLENILESFVQDLISSKSLELKEKTKKVLDIWTKHRTFPASVLASLTNLMTSEAKEKDAVQSFTPPISSDPRLAGQPVSTTPPVPPPATSNLAQIPATATNVQNALLALLAMQTNKVVPDTNANTNQTPPANSTPLEASQLALLQTLAQQAKGVQYPTAQPPVSVVVPAPNGYASLQQVNVTTSGGSTPQYYSQQQSQPQRWNDNANGGGERGGRQWRGRGRGGYRDSPPPRQRHSRSRSPPYRSSGTGRPRPYSPPNRPSLSDANPSAPAPAPAASGKDEFGRDIRSESPRLDSDTAQSSTQAAQPQVAEPSSSSLSVPVAPALIPQTAASTAMQNQPIQGHPMQSHPIHTQTQPIPSVMNQNQGLEGFDLTKFNFTSAASWQSLGKAWETSCGYVPGQEELMAFVMSGGAMSPLAIQNMAASNGFVEQPAYQSQSRGRGRGRGGSARGGGYVNNSAGEWGNAGVGVGAGYGNFSSSTDAVVLGGDSQNEVQSPSYGYEQGSDSSYAQQQYSGVQLQSGDQPQMNDSANTANTPKASGGKMQRVGDRWVWQAAS